MTKEVAWLLTVIVVMIDSLLFHRRRGEKKKKTRECPLVYRLCVLRKLKRYGMTVGKLRSEKPIFSTQMFYAAERDDRWQLGLQTVQPIFSTQSSTQLKEMTDDSWGSSQYNLYFLRRVLRSWKRWQMTAGAPVSRTYFFYAELYAAEKDDRW